MVYDHGGNDDPPPMFRVTVLFEGNSGKTIMDMTQGWTGTFDKLEAYLKASSTLGKL